MIINNIKVRNFRCIHNAELEFNKNLNIVVGNNGQGKTSLLESIYLLAFTKSHKTNFEREVIMTGCDFTKVNAAVDFSETKKDYSIVLTKKTKKTKINDIEQKKLSEYIGKINVIMFSPEDLRIIKGDPNIKRKFIDLELGQTSPIYIFNLLMYKKILKQRNELLKKIQKTEIDDYILLDVITEQLSQYASKIVAEREIFIETVNSIINSIHRSLTKDLEKIRIEYKKTYKDDLFEELKNKYKYDILVGSTSMGPHRDDLVIYLNDEDISIYGSQGQQRTAVLSIKLSLIEFIKSKINEYPILLLDDVFSELDSTRLESLIEYIKRNIQTFITTTDISFINDELREKANFYYVEKGNIR
ncbi:DNA replication/repair protein RecF [Mycoplasmatota bacterium zrk1]